MAITEQSRHQLFEKLEEVLGMEEAGTLFDLIPPMGWGDLATKQDIDSLRVATKQDIDSLRTETKHDMHLLRLDLEHGLYSLKSDLKDELTTKLRGLFFAIFAAFLGVVGLLLTTANWI